MYICTSSWFSIEEEHVGSAFSTKVRESNKSLNIDLATYCLWELGQVT
jgi:hypothetical protein